MTNKQIQVLSHILKIGNWYEKGYDKFKVTHRGDGRIQVSWKYRDRSKLLPNPISDEYGFIYLTRDEFHNISQTVRQALSLLGIKLEENNA